MSERRNQQFENLPNRSPNLTKASPVVEALSCATQAEVLRYLRAHEMANTVDAETSASAPASAVAAENAPFRVPTIGEVVAEGEPGEENFGDEIKGSLCMACGGDGTTRMLTTKIPFFREVILSSFECDDCHWRNNEVRLFIWEEKITTL